MPEISLKPEIIAQLGPLAVSNSLLSSILMFVLLSSVFVLLTRKLSVIKPSKSQAAVEILYESLGNMFKEITEKTYYGSVIYSFVFSFFIYILASNWFGLMPIVGPIGVFHKSQHDEANQVTNVVHLKDSELLENNPDFSQRQKVLGATTKVTSSEQHASDLESNQHEEKITFISCLKERNCILGSDGKINKIEHFIPVFRAPTADLSVTMSLALISVLVTNILGIHYLGVGFLKKYINFSGAIDFFVGILELVSEIGKIVSFSFRLFGNIFAGEVLLIVINFIGYGIVTLPFIGLEFFIGIIQALVFYMLTIVFISLAAEKH